MSELIERVIQYVGTITDDHPEHCSCPGCHLLKELKDPLLAASKPPAGSIIDDTGAVRKSETFYAALGLRSDPALIYKTADEPLKLFSGAAKVLLCVVEEVRPLPNPGDAPPCAECGTITVRADNKFKCLNCGLEAARGAKP